MKSTCPPSPLCRLPICHSNHLVGDIHIRIWFTCCQLVAIWHQATNQDRPYPAPPTTLGMDPSASQKRKTDRWLENRSEKEKSWLIKQKEMLPTDQENMRTFHIPARSLQVYQLSKQISKFPLTKRAMLLPFFLLQPLDKIQYGHWRQRQQISVVP